MAESIKQAPHAPLPAPVGEGQSSGILVLAAHPNWRESRVNKRLLEAARGGGGVQVRDLYALYPDYDIDTGVEQAVAQQARLVVLLHPIQWYSMPALLKLWLDEVLTYGWAYGPGGTALQGKDLWLVATTGGPESSYHPQSYNRYFFEAFLPPYEQTAALCGMRFLPPLLLHGAHRAHEDAVAQHVEVFADRLRTYPEWPEIEDLLACPACEVPTTDRPLSGADASAE
ncbi:NAD(P)H-dependent oxidoreductase [Ramlibacter sp. WS9]|uniref:glutathione-regulated potassium-efflux system oxidoreductase KefF n=1 Tax=Ramlibacter sp. WS9 TaxID=1882741 RepID=UPI0011439DEB|nr:NAD(P)H-dependent oxidoreductase [Ramlibacter sp. WS9]ROZ79678.1 NAD(P)H dehydrogenase [Ramlibacter sp. WS9]